MNRLLLVVTLPICLLLDTRFVFAEAIVERASLILGIETYTLLAPGNRIDLSEDLEIVLGYPSSCRSEHIIGGEVVVGDEKSLIQGGSVSVEQMGCGQKLALSQDETEQSGASAWRSGDGENVVVFTRAPVLIFADPPQGVFFSVNGGFEAKFLLPLRNGAVDFRRLDIELEYGKSYKLETSAGKNYWIRLSGSVDRDLHSSSVSRYVILK